MTAAAAASNCIFGQKSAKPCSAADKPHLRQTLDEIDASAAKTGKSKSSWILLSRVGVDFLAADRNYGSSILCMNHREAFLDDWRAGVKCCNPGHASKPGGGLQLGKRAVSVGLSARVLEGEQSVVLPVGGKLCDFCFDAFDKKYPEKGESNFVFSKRSAVVPDTLIAPSPFCTVQDASEPGLTIKTEVLDDEDEEEHDHIVIDEEEGEQFDYIVEEEEEEEYDESELFSEDSDDDRTWLPEVKKKVCGSGATKRGKKRALPAAADFSDGEEVEEEQRHYYCEMCQITFYKHSSYKHHMRSAKSRHKEIAKREEEKNVIHKCGQCDTCFLDRPTLYKHMKAVHKNEDASKLYCEKCDIHLKNEAAYKSHNSKLHLERRNKLYYCRVCDQTFQCRLKHQTHIKTHRLWSGENPGYQCPVCGKLFSGVQNSLYRRHMATHDSVNREPDECSCQTCQKKDLNNAKKRKTSDSSDDILTESSITQQQQQQQGKKVLKRFVSITKDEENSPVAASGRDCPDRNWAAQFGYKPEPQQTAIPPKDLFAKMKMNFKALGNDQDDDDEDKAKEIVVVKEEVEKSSPEESESDEFTVYRVRGFKGRVKASLKKTPRTLSHSSLRTRRRIEELIERARRNHHLQPKKAKSKAKPRQKSTESPPRKKASIVLPETESKEAAEKPPEKPVEEIKKVPPLKISLPKEKSKEFNDDSSSDFSFDPDEDDDFDGFEEEDEALLIPLANGWVCEKKPAGEDKSEYSTTFWSPDGGQIDTLDDIRGYCAREGIKVDMSVFERALKKNPNKVNELKNGSRLSLLVDSIIDEEEQEENGKKKKKNHNKTKSQHNNNNKRREKLKVGLI